VPEINAIHSALCALIKTKVPDIQVCEPLGQQLEPEIINRHVIALPAVYIAFAGLERSGTSTKSDMAIVAGLTERQAVWSLFLVFSSLEDPITVSGMIQKIIDCIGEAAQNRFARLPPNKSIYVDRVENLYKGDIEKQPVSIFAFRVCHHYSPCSDPLR
jgi:hypothetical protein